MKTIKLFLAAAVLVATSSAFAQTYNLKPDHATIKWEGKKIGGAHDGNIKLKEGSFTVKNNKITDGTFIIDMKSITNNDIESEEYKGKLIGHLKSDDFFGVEKYPTAKLKITSADKFIGGKAKVKGDITIKGTTHPIEFEVKKDGKSYSALLTVDRSKFDIRYGSKTFFNNLGDKVIYDDFTLDINLSVM